MDGIAEITADAVVDDTGRRHPADVIVFAIGFHTNRFLWPMEVIGRSGVALSQLWGDDPKAQLGIMGISVPGFPNFFRLYGPGTNLAHAGSIVFHSECRARYVMGCLKALMERRARSLDCRPEVCDEYSARHDAAHAKMVWSRPDAGSWYENSRGRVTTTSPWRLLDHWRWTREPDLAEHEVR